MLTVGLTGSFASGKSTVAKMFGDLGAHVMSADSIAKQLLWRNGSCFGKVVQAFGKEILKRGRIDRAALANIVFGNKAERQKLESILHPAVRKTIRQRLTRYKAQKRYRVVVVEVPLLFEAGFESEFNVTIAVKSSFKKQLERSKKQRKISTQEAKKRIKAQWPLAKKIKQADYSIDNREIKKQTRVQVRDLWQKLQQMEKK